MSIYGAGLNNGEEMAWDAHATGDWCHQCVAHGNASLASAGTCTFCRGSDFFEEPSKCVCGEFTGVFLSCNDHSFSSSPLESHADCNFGSENGRRPRVDQTQKPLPHTRAHLSSSHHPTCILLSAYQGPASIREGKRRVREGKEARLARQVKRRCTV